MPRFRLLAREEGSFPCVVGKEFPAFLSHLKRRRSPQERREELQGRATIPRVPQMSEYIQGNLFSLHSLDFQSEDRLTPRRHVGQPCGKASWESPVGKPRGKISRESHRSLDPREGKRDTAATARGESARACPTRDEDLLPWGDSRSTPRSMSALERIAQVPAPTPHKILGPSIHGRGIPKGPRATRMGTGLY